MRMRISYGMAWHGQPDDKLKGIQQMISDSAKLIEDAKSNYLRKTGESLANPGDFRKTYWSLVNTVLNKAKVLINTASAKEWIVYNRLH